MKKLLFLTLLSVSALGQVINAPKIPNVTIQRLRSDVVNFSVQFQQNDSNINIATDTLFLSIAEMPSQLTRLVLSRGAGIVQVNNSTITISLTTQQVAALTKDVYQYRLYKVSAAGQTTRLYGAFWLVKGTLTGTGATINNNKIVVNYTASGTTTVTGSGSGGAETDPTISATIKAISSQNITDWNASYRTPASVKTALETLTGNNRLDATAIKNLPQGGGVGTETDPTVSATVKAISPQQVQAWDVAASSTSNIIYNSNYSANETDVNFWVNGSSTHSRTGGQLIVSSVDDAIGFAAPTAYREGQLIYVSVDFVRTGSDVVVRSCYGCNSTYTLTATGKYFFSLKRTYSYPIADFNVLLLQPTGVGGAKSFTLNSLKITDGGAGFSDNLPWVKIGAGAAATYNSVAIGKNANYNANFLDGVVLGTNAKTDQQGGVVVGADANGNFDGSYGASGGSDLIAVGYKARAYGWRTTAIGARAGAAGQSSTAIGAGAFAGVSHGLALGRGSFVYSFPSFGTGQLYQGSIIVSDGSQLYFGNGWAHRYNPHPVDDVEYSVNDNNFVPTSRTVVLHGHDAYDARTSPSSFNIAGGNLALMAGRGTGTGIGGKLQFYTAPANGAGQNEKNAPVLGLEIDATTNVYDGTRLLLYDMYNSTMKRVKLMPPDGSNRMILYIDN